ncbi:Integrator complex subunit 4, partial [Trichostrongylus colubriformis]
MSRRPDSTSLLVLERLLCQMTTDMDSRVRLSAIEGLSLLSGVEDGLTLHAYNTVKNSVGDSHRQVRILALRILLVFANKMPTLVIASAFSQSSDTKLQLCDDAFSVVCDAVNDQEVMVRTEAATILGEFQMVSDTFLDQTLDKKMMKTVQDSSGREQVKKVHQSRFAVTQGPQQLTRESRWKASNLGYQRQKQSAVSEWSSGKELNARCPPSQSAAAQDDESESIVPRGACGAFVSALEDEFMSVRRAAVYSLGKLASTRPSFATTALDHLADMFNDEIVEVRLDAIAALTPLIVHGELQKEQLETVLKCLDDAIVDSREALRHLLAKAEFADAEC